MVLGPVFLKLEVPKARAFCHFEVAEVPFAIEVAEVPAWLCFLVCEVHKVLFATLKWGRFLACFQCIVKLQGA